MKKNALIILAAFMLALVLAYCGSSESSGPGTSEGKNQTGGTSKVGGGADVVIGGGDSDKSGSDVEGGSGQEGSIDTGDQGQDSTTTGSSTTTNPGGGGSQTKPSLKTVTAGYPACTDVDRSTFRESCLALVLSCFQPAGSCSHTSGFSSETITWKSGERLQLQGSSTGVQGTARGKDTALCFSFLEHQQQGSSLFSQTTAIIEYMRGSGKKTVVKINRDGSVNIKCPTGPEEFYAAGKVDCMPGGWKGCN